MSVLILSKVLDNENIYTRQLKRLYKVTKYFNVVDVTIIIKCGQKKKFGSYKGWSPKV